MRKITVTVSNTESLISQWEWKENQKIGLFPDQLSNGSQKKAFWICKKHNKVYAQIIRARHRGQIGCELCQLEKREAVGRDRYIRGKAVLAITHPKLCEEWVSAPDLKYTPYTCLAGSGITAKWKCPKCGGEYDAIISNRAMKGAGCPYCAGQKVLSGYNDLKTLDPDLASEWSEKNSLSPSEVTVKSNKKVYWICRLGHDDYLSSVKQRSNGQGCPECAKWTQTSFPEQAIFFYIKRFFSDAVNRYNSKNGEIDIYVPSRSIGIEYNGIFYHKGKKQKDQKKRALLEEQGIRLISIDEVDQRVESFQIDQDHFVIYEHYNLEMLSELIQSILVTITPKRHVKIDCKKDRININELYLNSIRENSIAEYGQEILKEWDFEKNGKIRPEYVSYGSNQKYYWKCIRCGYSYLAAPKERKRGRTCPCCAGKITVKGINDLKTRFHDIASEWDYKKNGDVKPDNISFGVDYRAWWKCKNGHSWQAPVNRRTYQKSGCPYCSGRLSIKGENDLATTHPELIKEWDFNKNVLTPQDVKAGTNKKVWWVCKKKHSYQKAVSARTEGKGCPYCANRLVLIGYNDLLTTNPDLALEWNYEKNGELKPDMVTKGTHKIVWWKCPVCGFSWESKVVSRNNHTGCPHCHYKYWV